MVTYSEQMGYDHNEMFDRLCKNSTSLRCHPSSSEISLYDACTIWFLGSSHYLIKNSIIFACKLGIFSVTLWLAEHCCSTRLR